MEVKEAGLRSWSSVGSTPAPGDPWTGVSPSTNWGSGKLRSAWTDHENLYDIYLKGGEKVTFVFILLGTMKQQRIKCLSYYHISIYKPDL